MPKLISSPHKKWLILFSVSLGVFMMSLDTTIVNIVLPQLVSYFHTGLPAVEWVVMIYLLLISSLLLTYGRLGDMYGHKPIYILGFSVFTIASALNSLAPSIGFLIASRALQALGAGMLMAVVQAIIAATFDPSERGRAIGINAVMVSLGLASGPTIGGFLVSHFPWQSIFVVNIPIGLLGILMVSIFVPHKQGTPQKFDFMGALLSFSCLSTFLLALSLGQAWGWASAKILLLFGISLLSFISFIQMEKRSPHPMIRLQLFKNRLFSAANFAAMLNYLVQYVVIFLMPFYLLNYLHLKANTAGLIMSAFPILAALIAPFSGAISDKIGSRALTTMGMGLLTLAVLTLSSQTVVSSIWLICIFLSIAGLGNGLFLAPNNSAIMGSVPQNQAGIGSGMIATMRTVGQVMGVAASGAMFSNRLAVYTVKLQSQGYKLPEAHNQSFLWAFRDTYHLAAAVAVIAMIVCWGRGGSAILTNPRSLSGKSVVEKG